MVDFASLVDRVDEDGLLVFVDGVECSVVADPVPVDFVAFVSRDEFRVARVRHRRESFQAFFKAGAHVVWSRLQEYFGFGREVDGVHECSRESFRLPGFPRGLRRSNRRDVGRREH